MLIDIQVSIQPLKRKANIIPTALIDCQDTNEGPSVTGIPDINLNNFPAEKIIRFEMLEWMFYHFFCIWNKSLQTHTKR